MAIIGGSRAYGTPRPDIDIDIVVQLTEADEALLRESLDLPPVGPIRCGVVNFIVARTDEQYRVWAVGIERLKALAPVSRESAIEYFDEAFGRCADGQVVNGADSRTAFEIAMREYEMRRRAKATLPVHKKLPYKK